MQKTCSWNTHATKDIHNTLHYMAQLGALICNVREPSHFSMLAEGSSFSHQNYLLAFRFNLTSILQTSRESQRII